MVLLLIKYQTQINEKYQLINGTWKLCSLQFVKASPYPKNYIVDNSNNLKEGYEFFTNQIFEDKRGFTNSNKLRDSPTLPFKFIGNKSTYKIHKNKLFLFLLDENKWEKYSIILLTNDTLQLKLNDSMLKTFVKIKNKINNNFSFDKIIVINPNSFMYPRIESLCLDFNGNITFIKKINFDSSICSSAKINTDLENEIKNDFQQVDILEMKEKYEANVSDDFTTSVLFIKENKIIKTVKDYRRAAPTEFVWAYHQLQYITNYINEENKIQNINVGRYFNSVTDNKKYIEYIVLDALNYSLRNAKKVGVNFGTMYEFTSASKKNERILSDGRYFKIKNDTYDIGYNFCDLNSMYIHEFYYLDLK